MKNTLLTPLIYVSAILFSAGTIAQAEDLQVELIQQDEWDTGFCKDVVIYNLSDTKILWNISFNAGGVITDLWNANYADNNNTFQTTANGVDWNEYVEPDSNVTFGYCADKVAVPPESGELTIVESDNAEWDDGFCKDVTVNNTTEHDIDWIVTFPVNGLLTESWSSTYTQNSETLEVTAQGDSDHNIVQANSNITFGYCADKLDDENETVVENKIFNNFGIGFGGSYAFPFSSENENEKIWVSSVDLVLNDAIESNDYYSNIKDFDASSFDELQKSLKKSNFLVYWLVEGWEESWFNASEIQKAMDAGYTPVFNYWYFGDKMSSLPSDEEQSKYKDDNKKVADFLNKLNGTKLLIMEPEFNKENIVSSEDTQHQFASIIADAIDSIKAGTNDTLFSLAMMDTGNRGENETYEKCGYENCSLGDKYEWGRAEIVYNDLLSRLDFISFQQMVGQFSRDPSNPGTWDEPNPIAYSDSDIGIDNLSKRVFNFTKFLQDKYNKPIFLPYITVATATWNDENSNDKVESSEINPNGWTNKAETLYQELREMQSELQEKGLFGFAPMALFDDPQHDIGGYQYFMQNEYHLGIVSSGAKDATDVATNGNIVSKENIIHSLFD